MFETTAGNFYIDDLFFAQIGNNQYLQLAHLSSMFNYGDSNVVFVDNCDETLTSTEVAEGRRAYDRASKL